MTCSVNGIDYSTNPFTVYIGNYGDCNDDNSGHTYWDISATLNPPNKYYIFGTGLF